MADFRAESDVFDKEIPSRDCRCRRPNLRAGTGGGFLGTGLKLGRVESETPELYRVSHPATFVLPAAALTASGV